MVLPPFCHRHLLFVLGRALGRSVNRSGVHIVKIGATETSEEK